MLLGLPVPAVLVSAHSCADRPCICSCSGNELVALLRTNGPGRVANSQLEVDVVGCQVVPVTHVLHQHPQPYLQQHAGV